MLDISFSELLLIAVAVVVFIRPDDLPAVMRAMAKAYAQLRAFWHEMQGVFSDIAAESGLHDAKREMLHHTTFIEGDDGDMYEAYDLESLKLAASVKKENEKRSDDEPALPEPNLKSSDEGAV